MIASFGLEDRIEKDKVLLVGRLLKYRNWIFYRYYLSDGTNFA